MDTSSDDECSTIDSKNLADDMYLGIERRQAVHGHSFPTEGLLQTPNA